MPSQRHALMNWAIVAALGFVLSSIALGADNSPQVTLNVSKAAPRSVEPLTERAIARDYKIAWANLNSAFESNSESPLNDIFAGNASKSLKAAVSAQRRNGMTSRYLNQNHRINAVFYSPEGDVVELHDTAEYDLEIRDGDKTVHNEHAIVHYVVLMTPGVERWVIRQLEAVPQF
jgi:hypothetical protein